VELNDHGAPGHPSSDRLHYARPLGVGRSIAFAGLVAGFLAYAFGWLPPVVPPDALPRVWTLPAAEFLRATGMPGGWSWIPLLDRGDVLTLAAIALLPAVPLAALLVLVPFYAARRDRIYLAIVLAQIAVIAVAASGALTAAH
jgi:hypothetical protein